MTDMQPQQKSFLFQLGQVVLTRIVVSSMLIYALVKREAYGHGMTFADNVLIIQGYIALMLSLFLFIVVTARLSAEWIEWKTGWYYGTIWKTGAILLLILCGIFNAHDIIATLAMMVFNAL